MHIDPLSSQALGYAAFRMLYWILGLAFCLLLWRRPSPGLAVALVLALNLGAWLAYVGPLGRVYGLDVQRDAVFNVGMAACVAAGNSAWDHTQTGLASLEPFWSFVTAALSGFDPARVLRVYPFLTPLSLIAVGCALYWGLRGQGDDVADRWDRALVVFAVLGLSSFSMAAQAPIPPLWAGNFLLKPNHACGFGLAAIALGLRAKGAAWWVLGLVLGLLAWVFILHWAYLVAGLVAALALQDKRERRVANLAAAVALSALLAAPLVANLSRDFLPRAGDSADQVWAMTNLARVLALPNWVTVDLGPLLILGGAGVVVLWRRRATRDRLLLGLFAATLVSWLGLAIGSLFGLGPEPDELHYFLRFAVALCAAAALSTGAQLIARKWSLGDGQGHVIVMAALLGLTFPAYWDPPTMDRYYPWSLPALDKNVVAYGAWVRGHTSPADVFAAGPDAASWIPALAGRRVMLVGDARPPRDYAERKAVERTLLRSHELEEIQQAARKFGVAYLAVDPALGKEYRLNDRRPKDPDYEEVFSNPAVRIYRVP
jgi:hypothetical protein